MQLPAALCLEGERSVRIFRLLGYDIRQGFRQNGYKLLVIMLIALTSCLEWYAYKNNSYGEFAAPQGTCMDYLFFMLRGMKAYEPERDLQFIFPVRWILIYFYLFYATLHYPYRDLLNSVGNQLLTLGRSRRSWWISKCVWNIMFVLCYFLTIYATVFGFCKVAGESTEWKITEALVISFMDITFVSDGSMLAVCTVLLPVLVAMALSLLEMFLALFIRPFFGFCAVALLMLASAYCLSPWLIGNYVMPMRSVYAMESGVSFSCGLMMSLLVIVCCIWGGAKVFHRYDVINMTEM